MKFSVLEAKLFGLPSPDLPTIRAKLVTVFLAVLLVFFLALSAPAEVQDFFLEGQSLYEAGRLNEAIEAFKKSLEQELGRTEIYGKLA